MEVDYKLKSIKSELKNLLPSECISLVSGNIRSFVTNRPPITLYKSEHEARYKERSNGKFKNSVTNKELYNIVESIREEIINKNHHKSPK